MRRLIYRFLERISPVLRIGLFTITAIMLFLGWVFPLWLPLPERPAWEIWRSLAAMPPTVWALIDAWISWVKHRELPEQREIEGEIYEVLREIETLAIKASASVRLSECGVKVWALRRRLLRDLIRGEERRRLERVAVSPMYRAVSSSGLTWRWGMGVIGVALSQNDVMAVDVNAAWGKIRDSDEDAWKDVPAPTRMGLSYTEFRTLCRNGKPNVPVGPFVLAVPYYKGGTPMGVVALDMPAGGAEEIGLGGAFDASEDVVTSLMYALGKRVFER